MGYMQIAAKHTANTKQVAKRKAKVLPDKNIVEPVVKPAGAKTLPASPVPVPGTPFAALSDLMTKRK